MEEVRFMHPVGGGGDSLIEEHRQHHLVGLRGEVGEEEDLVGCLSPCRLATGGCKNRGHH